MTATGSRPARSDAAPSGRIVSSRAGFIVHREAGFEYPFFEEGVNFSRELVGMLNTSQDGYCSTALYREAFGRVARLHWLVLLRGPQDYRRLLDLVDNNQKWREWAAMDRLPDKGHGAWDKIFTEGSISETVYCPQHGVGPDDDDHDADDAAGYFQPPASHQSHTPDGELLHSGNDGALIHRSGRVFYQVREQARFYLFRWAQRITEGLPGVASAYSFEEMWGVQDRLHALIHLRSPEDARLVEEFERTDPQMREIQKVAYAPGTPGDGLWPYLFVPDTMRDTLLLPDTR